MSTYIQTNFSVLPGDFVNLGDAMLSLAAARRMTRDGGRVSVLPYRRPSDEVREEFEKEGFEVISMRDHPLLAFRVCNSSSIWIGGGHAIRNEVSLGWLSFTTVVSWLARKSGRNVRVIGSGATHIKSRWRRWLFGNIFSACDKVCVRDQLSAKSLKADFPDAAEKVNLVGDLAFLKGRLDFHANLLEEFSCVVSPGIDLVEGRTEDPQEILEALRVLFERFEMKHVIIVSHDSRSEFGLPFCEAFESVVLEALPVTVEVITQKGIEHGLMEPYGRARWIITGRLHGLIIGAMLRRRVFYTTGSAKKLRPFAELFEYGMATHVQDIQFPSTANESIAPAVLKQGIAAELNFNV